MDIGRAGNSSIEKTTCSECNGFGGTCRGGIVLLLNDVQRMFHEWNHESLSDVVRVLCLTNTRSKGNVSRWKAMLRVSKREAHEHVAYVN
jgi:hypothetical protein